MNRYPFTAGVFLKRALRRLQETNWDKHGRWIALFPPVLACAGFALALGQDTNWDVRNYHFYSGYALLNKPLNFDFAPAQVQTFFNPLMHVPSYVLLAHLPSTAVAALLGAVQGLNFYLLFRIAQTLLWNWRPASRFWLSFCSAASGCWGAVFVAEIGTTFGDSVISLLILTGLLILLRRLQPGAFCRPAADRSPVIAGAIFGLAAGLKLTTSIYVAAATAFLLFLPASGRRLRSGLMFLAAIGIGFAAAYGWWGWNLYSEYRNPIFPYRNALFRSSYYDLQNVTDRRFLPRTWQQTLFYPFYFANKNHLVGEIDFRDARLAVCYLAVITLSIAALISCLKRRYKPSNEHLPGARSPSPAFLAVFFAVSYIIWQIQSSIYRYLIVLELLAPILIASVIARLSAKKGFVVAFSLILDAAICLWMIPPDYGRQPFDDGFLRVKVPKIEGLKRSVVLMGEEEPTSYIIASFPAGTRFVRVRANFLHPGLNSNLDRKIQDLLSRYDSDHTFIYVTGEQKMVLVGKDAGFYGVSMDASSCFRLNSGSTDRGFLCRTRKAAPQAISPDAGEPEFVEVAGLGLEVRPQIVADGDTVQFTLVGAQFRTIDVLYTLNGIRQPPQERWRLDDRHSVQFPVSAATPKGFYHFIGIRNSAAGDPNRWTRVNAGLYVR